MTRKHVWLYLLPTLLFILIAAIAVSMQGWHTAGLDGQGPNPEYLLLFLLGLALALALAVTTLYAIFGKAARSTSGKGRFGAVGFHGALWLVLGLILALPHINTAIEQQREARSPEARAYAALNENRIEDFKRLYQEARQASPSTGLLDEEMMSWALENYRTDILAYLEAHGAPLVVDGVGPTWEGRVIEVLRSRGGRSARETLDMVNWVLAQNGPKTVSFEGSTSFSDVELYESAYRDIDTPDTRELLDVLVAHGANIVGCTETDSRACPLVYFAAKGNMPFVAFLLSHGADPNSADPNNSSITALSEATSANHADVAKLLLEYGAHPLP